MAENNEQRIKGNGNTQIIVKGDYHVGLNKNEVIAIINSFGYVNKDEIVEIVKDVINDIPDSKKIKPEKRIFVPLIQQLSYSTDEEYMKTKYKNMLASTMNADKVEKVHPSFINILSQLSSDEIKILDSLPLVILNNVPIINMRMKTNNQTDLGILQAKYFSDIGYGKCKFPENICKYIENLERLKLIEIPHGLYLTDNNIYDKLINHPFLDNIRKSNSLNNNVKINYEYDKKIFRLTNFGLDFISCCK